METKIMNCLKELRPEFDFENSDNFIEDDYLDSYDITTLVTELEEAFGCVIDGVDVRAENFVSIETIAKLVENSVGTII
ncbi:MAG: acyl carrier protein [Ruminococcus flavefaciens]|nr:acyl carrier protein [Ruminococcus flavefaciens]